MNKVLTGIACAGFVVLFMLGCSSSRYTIDNEFNASPVKTRTKMTSALHCLGDQLEKSRNNPGGYVFMVRDITDGTINNSYTNDGPLSDAGRIQLISILTAHTRPSYGVVLDEYPLMLKPVINEQIGLNRFGVPSKQNLDAFIAGMTDFTNEKRVSKGMPAVEEVLPLIIDGSFTRYDSSHTRSKGYGKNAGYGGDVEDERSASLDFGNSGSERSVTLVVNIIDPKNNVVVGTEGFDLKFYSNSKTARFRVAVDDYYYGFSNTDVRVETLHTAQQTLLEAGAIWILDNAYGHMVDFTPCFDTREKLALGRDVRSEPIKAQQAAQVPPPAPVEVAKTTGLESLEKPAKAALTSANYDKAGWEVRAGTFCLTGNAKSLFKMLNSSGYDSRALGVKIAECKGTRVWLGPFAEKTTAEKISAELERFTGEKGYIVNRAGRLPNRNPGKSTTNQ